jgi:hypothetical protein
VKSEEVQRFFRSLNILFAAMLAGQVVFLLTSMGLVLSGAAPFARNFHTQLKWLVPVLVFVVSIGALLLSNQRLARARSLHLLTLKLQSYQLAVVQHSGMLNGAGTFTILAFLLTGEPYYLLVFAAVLFLFVRQRPTLAHARLSLGLSDTELPAD